jgi:hypothetical protein
MNGLVRVHVHVGNQCTARHHFNAAGLEQIDPSIGRWSWKVLFALIIDNLEILDLESQLRVRAGSDLAQCDRLAVVFQIEKIDARIAAVDGLLPLVPDESRLSDIKVDFLEVIGRHVRQQQRDRACALARRDGVMFDVEARVTESPDYQGMVGAFIVDDKLYFMYYLAAVPYYYAKHRDEAEAIIKSATIATATG